MRTNIVKVVVLTFLFAGVTTTYSIPNVRSEEPPVIGILNNLGFANIEEITQTTFSPGTYVITLCAEFAPCHQENELSRYEVGTCNFIVLFEGCDGDFGCPTPPTAKTFTCDREFGLSFLSPIARYFTEHERNPDSPIRHTMVFKNLDNPNMLLIGFENLPGRGYKDMIISLEQKHHTEVPEFGIMTAVVVSLITAVYLVVKLGTSRRKKDYVKLLGSKRHLERLSLPIPFSLKKW